MRLPRVLESEHAKGSPWVETRDARCEEGEAGKNKGTSTTGCLRGWFTGDSVAKVVR